MRHLREYGILLCSDAVSVLVDGASDLDRVARIPVIRVFVLETVDEKGVFAVRVTDTLDPLVVRVDENVRSRHYIIPHPRVNADFRVLCRLTRTISDLG